MYTNLHSDSKNVWSQFSYIERTSSVDTSSGDSQDGKGDDSYEQVQNISTLNNSILRGYSISCIRQKTVRVNFGIVDTRITGRHKHVVSNCLLLFSNI